MISYCFDARGYYREQLEDYGFAPNNSTHKAPDFVAGFIPRWDGSMWHNVENHKNEQGYLNGKPYTVTEYGPLPAGFTCEPPEKPAPTLAEVKAAAIAQVDAYTNKSILAGFDYEFDGVVLHFSYDSFDQQNFADSANVATRVLAGEPGLPVNVTWNAYAADGSLKRLELGPADFLDLYTRGALGHKAACMEKGGQLKEAINAASEVQAVEGLLATLEA